MNRLDRSLGILLQLCQGKTVSATQLAQRFEVSVRTIYRDVEALCELGAPIYVELGRTGGFRLLDGYFLPPMMFTRGEAISLLLGLTLLRQLRVLPFPNDVETVEHKLLAALPDPLRSLLAHAAHFIGFEDLPLDVFHWDPNQIATPAADVGEAKVAESHVVNKFMRALLDGHDLRLHYRSPYQNQAAHYEVTPCGLLWDRDWWYLVGQRADRPDDVRLWRADRVLAVDVRTGESRLPVAYDVRQLLGRKWLGAAMKEWLADAPVKIRLTPGQAARLKQDWYYGHAHYEQLPDGNVLMSFGEDKAEFVLDLMRWLGPGAELVEPAPWRAQLCTELATMLAAHTGANRC